MLSGEESGRANLSDSQRQIPRKALSGPAGALWHLRTSHLCQDSGTHCPHGWLPRSPGGQRRAEGRCRRRQGCVCTYVCMCTYVGAEEELKKEGQGRKKKWFCYTGCFYNYVSKLFFNECDIRRQLLGLYGVSNYGLFFE